MPVQPELPEVPPVVPVITLPATVTVGAAGSVPEPDSVAVGALA